MNVFITGGNGFVGLNNVKALVDAGHSVSAYIRPNANTTYLRPLGVNLIEGELHDKKHLRKSLEGMDAIIHTAGTTGCSRFDIPELRKVNIEGTQNIVSAAIDAKIKRFVFTSTTSTIGASNSKNKIADEKTPLSGFRARNPYGLSKLAAERVVLSGLEKGMDAIILNPAEVVGEYDYNFQWGRIVLAIFHNQLPFIPPGGGSFCHAAEVGRAHVAALTKGNPGEKYILSGPSVTFQQYINAISQLLNKDFDSPKVNYKKLYLKALIHELIPKIYQKKPMVEAYRMRVFGGNYYFDCKKAERDLGYKVTTLDHMLNDCIAWYKQNAIIGAN